jgi:hypothetical protein
MRTISSANTEVHDIPVAVTRHPASRVEHPDTVEVITLVGFGGRITQSLQGDAVHNHRAAETASPAQRRLDRTHVVPVHWADVFQPEVFEHLCGAMMSLIPVGAACGGHSQADPPASGGHDHGRPGCGVHRLLDGVDQVQRAMGGGQPAAAHFRSEQRGGGAVEDHPVAADTAASG